MIKTSEEILADIDATIDQLIENASALNSLKDSSLFHAEIEALQKTQESLMARLAHMQGHLKREKEQKLCSMVKIEKKVIRFAKLNNKMIHHFSHQMKKMEQANRIRIGRNRKKG